jgi:glycogen operon protein
MATLLLSQGVPMLQGGDEIGRTQQGNNNAYCQDNEITWFDWNLDENKQTLLSFVKKLINICHEHPIFQRRNFFQGRPIRGSNIKDVMWLRSDGQEMTDQDWNSSWIRCFGMFLAGNVPDEKDERGMPLNDNSMILILNSHHDSISFVVPTFLSDSSWQILIDTKNSETTEPLTVKSGQLLDIIGRSFILLKFQPRDTLPVSHLQARQPENS